MDEAGDLGALCNPPRSNDQPVFILGGVFVDAANPTDLTTSFLELKFRYFPRLPYSSAMPLDRILPEIKGADVRANATRGSSNQRRHAIGFLDRTFGLIKRYDLKLVARIWVKGIGCPFDATPVYTSSVQGICGYFDHFLAEIDDIGHCIADSRSKHKNVNVSHSIFTRKFSPVAADYERLTELPTFGHSENHAGIQLCDIICSALLYPIACYAYCTGHVGNVHVQPLAADLRNRYGQQLKELQYRYLNHEKGRYEGGIVVSDGIGHQNGSLMFKERTKK